MTRRCGFSLIELLIVIAIIGVLSAIAAFATRGLVSRTAVQEGAQTVARAIDRARTEAKRTNVDLSVVIGEEAGVGRRIEIRESATGALVSSQTLPAGTRVAVTSGTAWAATLPPTAPLRFIPPYGALRVPIAGTIVAQVSWVRDPSVNRDVAVHGVFGRTALQ